MSDFIRRIWSDDESQDIAEYAVMLAVILVIVVGTIRLIGSNSNTVFSSVASAVAQYRGYFQAGLATRRPCSVASPALAQPKPRREEWQILFAESGQTMKVRISPN